MQVTRERLGPDELDHELIWFTVSVGSLGLAALWFGLRLPWPRCLFHDLTGLPCLTCGLTRSTIAFLHGHFLTALRWNPLVFGGLCGLSVYNGYALVALITRAPRFRLRCLSATERCAARFFVLTLIGLNWLYLLAHWRRF